jgi:hypothetical protein
MGRIASNRQLEIQDADMKNSFVAALATTMASFALSSLGADALPPGQVEFGKFSPPGGDGEFVEVNVGSSLISLAATFLQKEEPDIAQLLSGLKLVHVNVIGVSDENKADLQKRSQSLRQELEGKGWEKIVTAQQQGQDVGIYLKTEGKDAVQGLVVMVMDGNKQAVFVNVVGNIKPEQLATLGDRLHIDPLKKIGAATNK